jgi:hypothetical protein
MLLLRAGAGAAGGDVDRPMPNGFGQGASA